MISNTVVVCCSWDDPEGVDRLIKSTSLPVIVIEGKFNLWDGENQFPVETTHNICKRHSKKKKIFYKQVEGFTEAKKRDFCLKYASSLGYKWALIVDSDEILKIDMRKFKTELKYLELAEFGSYAILIDNYNIPQRKPRLIDLSENPYYTDNHSIIYSSLDGRDINQDITVCLYTIQSITIKHDKEFHSKTRFSDREKFGITNH